MMPTGCSHIGQYDRRCEECCSCPDAESCQDRNLACYAKAFSASADACIRCRFSEYCRDAREVGGFQVQHGRPDIRLDENYDVLADRAAANVTDPQETDFPLRDVALVEAVETLIADCNYNPMTIAIVFGRYSGLSYNRIAKMLHTSKQLVLYRIKQIKNPELVEYLREKSVSKHFHNVIKDTVESEEIRNEQMLFEFMREK